MKRFAMFALSMVICMMLTDYVGAGQTPQKSPGEIYGSQLMTPEERTAYRTRMRSLKTEDERAAYRLEHHQKLQERAKEMGKTLPDMPGVACADMHRKMHGGYPTCTGDGCNQAGGCMHGMKPGGTCAGCCGGTQPDTAASGVTPEAEGDPTGHTH